MPIPDPAAAARSLRDTIWAPHHGDALPIDPAWIAGRLGLQVYQSSQLDRDIAGILRKQPGLDAEIYLNAGDSLQRRRFTCAHELGHYVRRAATDPADRWGYLDRRNALSSPGSDPEEIWANQFAAELLMPAQQIRAEHRLDPDPIWLANRFAVSTEAIGIRLRTLGLAPR